MFPHIVLVDYGFECLQPPRPTPQLTVTKISTYTIYIYVFITVKTAPHVNRLSRTAQTAVTIRSHKRFNCSAVLTLIKTYRYMIYIEIFVIVNCGAG